VPSCRLAAVSACRRVVVPSCRRVVESMCRRAVVSLCRRVVASWCHRLVSEGWRGGIGCDMHEDNLVVPSGNYSSLPQCQRRPSCTANDHIENEQASFNELGHNYTCITMVWTISGALRCSQNKENSSPSNHYRLRAGVKCACTSSVYWG
jgi:hypothetical protein